MTEDRSLQSKKIIAAICVLGGLLLPGKVLAQEEGPPVEKLSVLGQKESLPTRPGSAHVLNRKDLEDFEINDIHRMLRSVPGVNIQEEDGFGLRPNIGLRGAHPHRSKKVTLMDDGVLIAPAPYSAPAAYYFPQLDNVDSIEVFKGVPSTLYGPNSVGGAINIVSRINDPGVQLGTTYGSYNFNKYDFSAGFEAFGSWSLDYNRAETTGFKTLANKDNTGFVRNNVRGRWDKSFGSMNQNITLKFNWSDEDSNETYTGLTTDDFNSTPYARYAATELDEMKWTHRQYFVSYGISPLENLRSRITLYHHEFDRTWNKLNGFYNNGVDPVISLDEILNNPGVAANYSFYEILRGDLNSSALSGAGGNRGVIDIGDNQRRFFSQGVQLGLDYELEGFGWSHLFNFYYRLHLDGINRFHESSYYNMTGGTLVENTGLSDAITLYNTGRAQAQTFAFKYETIYEDLAVSTYLRAENIDYRQQDQISTQVIESGDDILAPGIGLYYQVFKDYGVLAGVNKGFTPVGPGQPDAVHPEEAVNYELGLRKTGKLGAELIGFYSDYSNILGTCTQSSGCNINQLDQRFNGGEAMVAGTEFILKTEMEAGKTRWPVQISGTYTQAQFRNSFSTTNPEWGVGNVESGDPIPYIPEWQGQGQLGFIWKEFSSNLVVNYLGRMADQAVALDREYIEDRWIFDLSMAYRLASQTKIHFRVDNLLDEKYAVSRRPFGLRPGRPQAFFIGVDIGFF